MFTVDQKLFLGLVYQKLDLFEPTHSQSLAWPSDSQDHLQCLNGFHEALREGLSPHLVDFGRFQ